MVRFHTDLSKISPAEAKELKASHPFVNDFVKWTNWKNKHAQPIPNTMLIVDSGVYDLKSGHDYCPSPDDRFKVVQTLPKRPDIFINVPDYPLDMYEFTDESGQVLNLEWTAREHARYVDLDQNLIFTVQAAFKDIADFKVQYRKLLTFLHQHPIRTPENTMIGMGNMCRVTQPSWFSDLGEAIKSDPSFQLDTRWTHHFFAPRIDGFERFLKYDLLPLDKISLDSTKWTKACNKTVIAKRLRAKGIKDPRRKTHPLSSNPAAYQSERPTFLEYYLDRVQECEQMVIELHARKKLMEGH